MQAAKDGSAVAFEQLYRAMAGQVSSYLRWHRATDPDGLTNDVFAQVHRNLPRFTGDEQGFRSWVFTIAHHRMIDDRRRVNRMPPVDDDAGVEEHVGTGDVEDDVLAWLAHDRVHIRHLCIGIRDVDRGAAGCDAGVADRQIEYRDGARGIGYHVPIDRHGIDGGCIDAGVGHAAISAIVAARDREQAESAHGRGRH